MGEGRMTDNGSDRTREHSRPGIVSFIIGLVSLSAAIILFLMWSGSSGIFPDSPGMLGALMLGAVVGACGSIGVVATSIAGLAIGIPSLRKRDSNKLFPELGVVFNAAALLTAILILVKRGG